MDGYTLSCQPEIEMAYYINTQTTFDYSSIKKISTPTTLICAQRSGKNRVLIDSATDPKLAKIMPQTKLIDASAYTHLIPLEDPDFASRVILNALKSHAEH